MCIGVMCLRCLIGRKGGGKGREENAPRIRSEVVGIRSEPTIPLKSRSPDVKVSGLIVRRKGVDMLPVASSVKGRKVRIRARVRLPNRYPVWW